MVNESRSDIPRILLANTGGKSNDWRWHYIDANDPLCIRFDLVQGPFTYDDSFIVIPFLNKFLYMPEVPFELASVSLHTSHAIRRY